MKLRVEFTENLTNDSRLPYLPKQKFRRYNNIIWNYLEKERGAFIMLQFLETGKALYVLTAICLLGVMSRFLARNLYKRLIRETDNMTLTKNRYLRELKQKTENTYRLNQGIHNTLAYLEKQLFGFRFMGLSLNGWTSFSGQMTLLCFLAGGAAAFGSYWFRSDNYYIVLYGSMGILTGLFTMLVDYGVNLSGKRHQLLTSLQDYLENSLFNRLSKEMAAATVPIMEEDARETARSGSRDGIRSIRSERTERTPASQKEPDPAQPAKRERAARPSRKELTAQKEPENSRRDIDYLKRSLEQIAASREKNRTDGDWVQGLTQDEMQLVGDILKEYLA